MHIFVLFNILKLLLIESILWYRAQQSSMYEAIYGYLTSYVKQELKLTKGHKQNSSVSHKIIALTVNNLEAIDFIG